MGGPPDGDEIMHANALNDGEAAAPAVLAGDQMSCQGGHDAMLTGRKLLAGPGRPGLDNHRALEADKDVRDGAVVMPRDPLSVRQGQYLYPHAVDFRNQLPSTDCVR